MDKRADKELERAKNGEALNSDVPFPSPALNIIGMSGAAVLKACGEKEPFAHQADRIQSGFFQKEQAEKCPWSGVEGRESDEDLGGLGHDPISHGNMMEFMPQCVKPWDDDAGNVLRILNGGF